MFELLIPLIGGVALVLFILWEEFRPEKPLSRKTMEAGFEPGHAGKVTALFMLGATGICFGLFLIANPVHPPFTGYGAFISSVLYAMFGPYGEPALFIAFSVVAIVGGFVVKNSRSHQASKSSAG
jgi:hypothetical protein